MIKADVINTKREAQANPSPTLMAEAEKKQTETGGRRRHAARTTLQDRKRREQAEGRKPRPPPYKVQYLLPCHAWKISEERRREDMGRGYPRPSMYKAEFERNAGRKRAEGLPQPCR